eukprot:11328508-Heterocapsa_arctica.AAC.1
MTGCQRRCPPWPGLNEPWVKTFHVPIIMVDVSSNYNGFSNARYTGNIQLPEHPCMREVVRPVQMSLAEETDCVGTGDSADGQTFGSLRVIFSYYNDVDKVVLGYCPRGEHWDKTKATVNTLLRKEGRQRLKDISAKLN